MISMQSLVALLVLLAIAMQEAAAQKYTGWPIQPIYDAENDLRKGDTALVFVYSCMCPRSQRTIPILEEAAEKLHKYYGVKTKSLEYYQTGFEYMKLIRYINKFPILMMHRADGSKVRYHGIDPPYAESEDFVRFALDNEYSTGSANSNSIW